MKRIAIAMMIVILLLVGCAKVEKIERKPEPINQSMFIEVEHTGAWRIVADRETGVMYAVSFGGHSVGIFTLLVDADGKPLIYTEGQDDSR